MTATTPAPTTDTATGAPAEARLPLGRLFPAAYRAMSAFAGAVRDSPLDELLVHLVKLRASQINGCAYCLALHAKEARAAGESQQRLDVLSAWDEVPVFNERERAALALTESITRVADTHVPDAAVDAARAHFSDEDLAALVFHIVTINAWNRIAITARMPLPAP
jgi:AhpD family alkylhydroperoxidase